MSVPVRDEDIFIAYECDSCGSVWMDWERDQRDCCPDCGGDVTEGEFIEDGEEYVGLHYITWHHARNDE